MRVLSISSIGEGVAMKQNCQMVGYAVNDPVPVLKDIQVFLHDFERQYNIPSGKLSIFEDGMTKQQKIDFLLDTLNEIQKEPLDSLLPLEL